MSSEYNNPKGKSLADFLLILVKWRKLIILNFVMICAITAIVALVTPKWYKAKCSILPPEEEGLSLGMLSSLASFIPGGVGGMELPLLATPSDVFASILRSRTVQNVIIRENDLMKVLDIDNMDETLEALSDLTEIAVGDEGIIYLSVETKNAELSVKMAKDYIRELDRVNRQKRKTKAREMRRFIENRLAQNKTDLKNAEDALMEFQEKNNLVSVEDQTRATLAIVAQLMAELQMKNVELGVMETTFNQAHQQVRMLKSNIRELEKQIKKLATGGPVESSHTGGVKDDFSIPNIPLKQMPNLGLEYFRLLREVKVQEAIFELIMQQYEQAKIQEKRDTPTIQILDNPVLPEIKSRPQRRLMVMIAGFMSLVVSVILVLALEHLQQLKESNPAEYAKFEQSYAFLRQDLNSLLRRKKN